MNEKIWNEECIWYMQRSGHCAKCDCVHKSMDPELWQVVE